MTFPVVGSNIPLPYEISNSLRFNDGDSPYLSKSFSTVTSSKKFTVSFWFKPSAIPQSNYSGFLDVGGDHAFALFSDSTLYFFESGGAQFYWRPQRLFRDCSAWYHIVLACDSTLSTQTDRVKIYVNGVRETSFHNNSGPSQNYDFALNTTSNTRYIGTKVSTSSYYDGYLAEYYQIDGQQLQASDFGEFDENSGVWKPKIYEGTFGDAGYYLKFNNTGNMGEDSSGNDNTWTPTNLSGTTDVTTDTPTNNFCTMNPLIPNPVGTNHTFSEGNLKITGATSISGYAYSTYSLTQGKWYFEFRHLAGTPRVVFGDIDGGSQQGMYFQGTGPGGYVSKMVDNSATTGTVTWANNDIIGLAFDFDAKTFKVFHNGSEVFDETYTIDVEYFAILSDNSSVRDAEGTFNFGQDSSFAGTETRQNNSDGNGYGDFYYTPPSGYLALCTQNLATELSPTIDDGSQYFNTAIWTGTGSAVNVDVGFQPDWVWLKSRNVVGNHRAFDSTRGATKSLKPNTTDAEATESTYLSSFNSDGFTSSVFSSSNTAVSWNWKANGGTTSSNTDGSITSTVQANTTAGFSVVTYTGTGSAGTIGHGLSNPLDMIIVKSRTQGAGSRFWAVYHSANTSAPETDYLRLNGTDATADSNTIWNDTAPTSSVFSVNASSSVNNSSDNYVAYCFHSVEGYSKFGSYAGNGSSDGTFVYTGFRPAIVIQKSTTQVSNWITYDNKRPEYNVQNKALYPNLNNAEGTSTGYDFVSNGFKLRTSGGLNSSGHTYIYMAFAENPFVTSGAVPVTAR